MSSHNRDMVSSSRKKASGYGELVYSMTYKVAQTQRASFEANLYIIIYLKMSLMMRLAEVRGTITQ